MTAAAGGPDHMNLTDAEVAAVAYALDVVVRQRASTGRGCPPEVTAVHRRIQAALTAPGHQNWCDGDDSSTIGTVEAARLLGRPERWVRRHTGLLGGVKNGDRWRYPRPAVEQLRSTT